MNQFLKCILTAFAAILVAVTASAQVTTSSLFGAVVDENSEPLAGAAIVAVHVPFLICPQPIFLLYLNPKILS